MASIKIDLFFQTPAGFDGHIEAVPGEGESGLELLKKIDTALSGAGCKPRPQPQRYGGGKAKEPLPTVCPVCQGAISVKDWVAKDGKKFKIHSCKDDKHFKRFIPAA